MKTFADYKQTRELAELCVQQGIDLAPLVEELESLMLDTTLTSEEIYNEFLQRAANWVGNMAGRAARGVGNMVNNFKQGYQQGHGPQQAQQGTPPMESELGAAGAEPIQPS